MVAELPAQIVALPLTAAVGSALTVSVAVQVEVAGVGVEESVTVAM